MSNILWKSLLVTPAVLGAALMASGAALAADAETATEQETPSVVSLEEINQYNTDAIQLAQVTSVSELTDVSPTDWAFTALQRLVEEYNCIEGYPDRTFRGRQSMTRYEFAAGLNACLDQVVLLLQTGGLSNEDLEAIQRLQDEFAAELATLRGRVDALEADVAELEANQFSTTTKLRGQVDAHVTIPFDDLNNNGGNVGDPIETGTTFVTRARLNFDTSFTGEDRLRIRLQASNGAAPLIAAGGLANASGAGDSTYDVRLDDFYYTFPFGNAFDVTIAANSILTDDFVTSTIVPFDGPSVADPGGPLFYDFEMGGGAGAGFNWAITDSLVLDAGYSVAAGAAGDPAVGIFSGAGQSYIAQLSYLSDSWLDIGLAYLHGTPSAGAFATNTYAVPVNFKFGNFAIGGYYAYHDQENTGNNDSSYMGGVAFYDLFGEGNSLGIYGGIAPNYANNDPLYIEGYYEWAVNEFLTITPAVIYGDLDAGLIDDTGLYGVIRTTFRF